jgi:hypothetical protein
MTVPDIAYPLHIAQKNADKLSSEFLKWLPNNQHIWQAFVANTDKIIARGFKHYSSKTIVEYIRHETALHQNGGDHKLNNNITPYLSRLYDLCYPEKAGLFEYRVTFKEKACPSASPAPYGHTLRPQPTV